LFFAFVYKCTNAVGVPVAAGILYPAFGHSAESSDSGACYGAEFGPDDRQCASPAGDGAIGAAALLELADLATAGIFQSREGGRFVDAGNCRSDVLEELLPGRGNDGAAAAVVEEKRGRAGGSAPTKPSWIGWCEMRSRKGLFLVLLSAQADLSCTAIQLRCAMKARRETLSVWRRRQSDGRDGS
jgi:hypothetical protein